MQKKDTAILMKEAQFDLQELFFSITEYDSTIVSGNKTFIRISEYDKCEIIGEFHNIIRHQDMPRIIFKVLWEYLKANKPVVAYVKNRTKNGASYWVLAAVFPLGVQYISIRIKPNTPIFDMIKEIYFRLLMAETKSDIQESEKLLIESLTNLGFRDYDHYMNEVLLTELLERKRLCLEQKTTQDDVILNHSHNIAITSLYNISKSLLFEYEKWFDKIKSFQKVKTTFEEKGFMLRTLARDIILLSLNASVASYKLEENGETFGVLASDIRQNAKENDILITNVDNIVQSLSESLSEITFLVSYTNLQMEMVAYFIKEILENSETTLDNSVNTLYTLITEYNKKLFELPSIIDKTIKKTVSQLEELEQQFMYLGYIQIYGIIESARSSDDKLGFSEIFSQLKTLVVTTSEEISLMKNIADNFSMEIRNLIKDSSKIQNMLNRLIYEISNINSMQG